MPNIIRRWTDADIARLTDLASKGATAARAAAALNRNIGSVKKAARLHGLKLIGTREAKAAIRAMVSAEQDALR